MATKEEMVTFNPDCVQLSTGELEKEMQNGEITASNDAWQTGIDEVYTQPDVQRTTFLWQVMMKDSEGPDGNDDDEEVSHWVCLPQHWQTILNQRLSEFHSKIQDAEALYLHRRDTYGDEDIKSKNSLQKLERLKAGEGASSYVLISKSTGKEASADVYNKAISRSKTTVTVLCGPRVVAYKFNISDMSLETMTPAGEASEVKNLRIVSVTGRSREVQEIRVHLTALSLATSSVMGPSSSNYHPPTSAGTGAEGEKSTEAKTGICYLGMGAAYGSA